MVRVGKGCMRMTTYFWIRTVACTSALFGKGILPVVTTQGRDWYIASICRSLCEYCAKMFLPLVICLFAALGIHEATGQPAGIVQLTVGGSV